MDISVVVPAHNQIGRLKLVLAGLHMQTLPSTKFEILVVDDGSVDGTGQYLQSPTVAGLRPMILARNGGRCKARNAGIAAAKGELIVFLDGDALPHPALLETYWGACQGSGCQAAFCGYCSCLPQVEPLADPADAGSADRALPCCLRERLVAHADTVTVTQEMIRDRFSSIAERSVAGGYPIDSVREMQEQTRRLFEEQRHPRVGWLGFTPHNGAVSRELLLSAEGFDETIPFCEGWELAYRLCRKGVPLRFLPAARSYHLYHRHGFSSQTDVQRESDVRLAAWHYMVRKHNDPYVLLVCFLEMWRNPFIPREVTLSDVLALDRAYREMTPGRWRSFRQILECNPLWAALPTSHVV